MAGFTSLYGFTGLALEKARELVEHALKVKLHAHESFYHGGDYYRLEQEDVTLILQRNYDCIDDEDFAEPEFPNVEVLLYLDGCERAMELERLLVTRVPEAVFLRRD
jgi:hypothetical protein